MVTMRRWVVVGVGALRLGLWRQCVHSWVTCLRQQQRPAAARVAATAAVAVAMMVALAVMPFIHTCGNSWVRCCWCVQRCITFASAALAALAALAVVAVPVAVPVVVVVAAVGLARCSVVAACCCRRPAACCRRHCSCC